MKNYFALDIEDKEWSNIRRIINEIHLTLEWQRVK